MAVQLIWYKRDLRMEDHSPLTLAANAGPCVAIYVYEPELIEAPDSDAAHLNFVNESLIELRDNLRRIAGELLLRVGRMPEVLEQIHEPLGIAKI